MLSPTFPQNTLIIKLFCFFYPEKKTFFLCHLSAS